MEWLLIEGGPIETASACFYFVAAFFMGVESHRSGWLTGRAGAVLLAAGGFRELDFHSRFTTGHVLSSDYFLSGRPPLLELIVVLAILLVIGAVGVRFLAENWSGFWTALQARRLHALSAAAAMSLIAFTVFLDRAAGHLRQSYGASAADLVFVMWIAEETLEILIPLLLIAAIVQASVHPQTRALPAVQTTRRAA